MGVLAVYDTTGIQSYIFASNKLRENVGASILVRKVLSEYLTDVIHTISEKEKAYAITDWEARCDKPLEIADGSNIYAEIIYVGGGNAYVAFKDYDAYKNVTKKFLFKVYDKTAGIGIASAFVETNFIEGYSEQFQYLLEKLSYAKGNINHPIPVGNQPITTSSLLTGLPVIDYDPSTEFEGVSAEQLLKRNAYRDEQSEADLISKNESTQNSIEMLNQIIGKFSAQKPKEFSDLERGNSFLAVIHLDGNSMGSAIMEYSKGEKWTEIVPRVRKMSCRISKLFKEAYYKMAANLAKHCAPKDADEKTMFPLINIINDGDDITCVVSGQYGISFAAQLLRAIETLGESNEFYPFPEWARVWPEGGADRKPRISACAGVTLFHSHYPFSEAYKMAEECCANAKRYTRNAKRHTSGITGSFIDFHLHQSGAVVNLKQFRKEQYTTKGEKVICRPYCVSSSCDVGDVGDVGDVSGDVFKDIYPLYSEFERLMHGWALADKYNQYEKNKWPRSRLKALRKAIRTDGNEVIEVIDWCKSRGYRIPDKYKAVTAIEDEDAKEDKGDEEEKAKSEFAMLFDVLELADIYEEIPRGENDVY